MKENTEEKNLVEKNEENIFTKIKSFFKNLFKKKDIIEEKDEEIKIENDKDNLESEMEKSTNFRESLKDFNTNEVNIFDLQRRYRKGEIADGDLTQEQINSLCQLYDSQINELKRVIASRKQQLEKYKKINKQKVEEE